MFLKQKACAVFARPLLVSERDTAQASWFTIVTRDRKLD